MVVDLKLSKEQGQPFGFRLIGGADFEIPLTVSRVVEYSTAYRAGMLEGDVVVRINDMPTLNMSHEEAHLALVAAGLEFGIGVLRASSVLPESNEPQQQQQQQQQVPISGELQKEQDRIDKIISDAAVTDEEIAELLSGEAEVLKGHGVMGVNFKRMMPKAGVFKQSEVFQVLNDQQLKTKDEMEKEEKMQWTTFLQKPDRAQPRPKNEQVIVNSYKPLIVKQPKPKCAPDYRATPEPQPFEPEPEPVQEEFIQQQQDYMYEQQEMHSYVAEVSAQTIITTQTRTEDVTFEQLAADASYEEIVEETINEEQKNEEDEVSEVSSAFAEQLANVQTQLMALSHLPKTIQSTLDEITKQLQQLIPPMKVKGKSVEPEMKAQIEAQIEAQIAANDEIESITVNATHETEVSVQIITTTTEEETIIEEEIDTRPSTHEIEEFEEAQEKLRQQWEHKREKESQKAPMSINVEPKDTKGDLSAELKQKVIQDRNTKQKKARDGKFRGLQPQERPIHLPGGRKWRGEKDAMNEELIAEIISSQAELIMGTTLGKHSYESPVLCFDERVNFLKYQKPEKDLSFLKNSETYRTIHHLTPMENGIEKRPATVAAEEDILKCASPNPCNQLSS